MLVVGINEGYSQKCKKLHDGSCVVLRNRTVIGAVSEERVTREKRAGGYDAALALLTESLAITPQDIDLVVTSSCCDIQPCSSLSGTPFSDIPIIGCNHHLSHAYSAFYASPFDEAIVIVIDSGGNTLDTDTADELPWWQSKREQHSYFVASKDGIEFIGRDFIEPGDAGMGEIYRAFTYYLGWPSSKFAGNTMALAGCGTDSPYSRFKIFSVTDGKMTCRTKNNPPDPNSMIEELLDRFNIEAKKRRNGEPIGQIHIDLARWLQGEIEDAFVNLVNRLINDTDRKNVCFAGGVAYNCKAINSVMKKSRADGVFVSPVAGDHGQALGNAIYGYRKYSEKRVIVRNAFSPYLGPEYDTGYKEIVKRINRLNLPLVARNSNNIVEEAARLLSEGAIIGWFQGRSEFGPRALGNRSILASPEGESVRDRLNRIKGREAFMPLAPSVLEKDVANYFEPGGTEFMSVAVDLKTEPEGWLRNVSHRDGTARIQVVKQTSNPMFYNLVNLFREHTDIPMVLNTSFNALGEPIVETVDDALECFIRLELDYLIIGNSMVTKDDRERTVGIKFGDIMMSGIKWNRISDAVRQIIPHKDAQKRNRFLLFEPYIDWVKDGRKKTTIRYGRGSIDYPSDISLPMLATKDFGQLYDRKVGRAVIQKIELKPFGSLSIQDALNDGFFSLSELKDVLTKIYGEIADNEILTIYTFRLST